MKKYNIDWFEIESLVNHLCEKINSHDKKYQNILGLQRGGLIPAVMVSHILGIPMVKGDITPHTSCFEPTLWSKRWSNSNWIVYPWEREDSKTIQDYKVKVG